VIEAAWTKKRAQNEFSAHVVQPIVWKSAKPGDFKSYRAAFGEWRKSRPGGHRTALSATAGSKTGSIAEFRRGR